MEIVHDIIVVFWVHRFIGNVSDGIGYHVILIDGRPSEI